MDEKDFKPTKRKCPKCGTPFKKYLDGIYQKVFHCENCHYGDAKKKKEKRTNNFNEESFVNTWWRELGPSRKANVYRDYVGEDPIDEWKRRNKQ